LKELGLIDRLNRNLREDLKTAFLRTSFEISSRSLVAEERGHGAEVGLGKAPWLGLEFLGKISGSYKQTRSDEEALKYLPYDEKAAEFDILGFSRRLLSGPQPCRSRWQRWWRRLWGTDHSVRPIKVVFILDELDKLEARSEQDGKSALDPVLQALKSIFTASAFSFVFIGGKEVEERLLEDVSRGDSIYESIFAYDLYLPCLWEKQDDIVLRCFEPNDGRDKNDAVALYLRYKGRGVPRRTWRELNRHVLWGEQGPALNLDLERRRYMEVFAKVEEALATEEAFKTTRGVVDHVQLDRQRLCFYYAIDWVLSRGHEPFNLSQVRDKVRTFNLLGLVGEATFPDRVAQSVVKLLLRRAFIELAFRERTLIGQVGEESMYRLAPWVLLAFQGSRDKQWVPEEAIAPPPEPMRPRDEKIGPYRVLHKIGEGGFAVVYRVADEQGHVLAAKILRANLAVQTTGAVELFKREIQVLSMMEHSGIVRIYDSGEEEGRPYLVMDLLEGISLRRLLDRLKSLDPGQACAIASELAAIFGYVHSRGFVRLDIKPSNVFLTKQSEIKVLDFGIVAFANRPNGSSQKATMIGTPGYMAPEQAFSGQADPRADIFALGVVLYEMLTGQLPFRADPAEFERAVQVEPASVSQFVSVPTELDSAVLKALARDPMERFQTMEDFAKAITHLAVGNLAAVIRSLNSKAEEEAASSDEATNVEWTETADRHTGIGSQPVPPVSKEEAQREVARESEHRVADLKSMSPLEVPGDSTPRSDTPGVRKSVAGVDQTDEVESIAALVSLVHSGPASVQEPAFGKLCQLSLQKDGRLHLLFDFARRLCLWGGSKAEVSKLLLTAESLRMGRDAAAVQLPLADSSVSRQHVAFFPSEDGVEVEDLSTANGTFLNGKRCRRERLSDSDILRVGSREIVLHILSRNRTVIL